MVQLWDKFIIFVRAYYEEHKDDIVIAFILGSILGIFFKATVYTWFVSLWVTLAYQMILNIIQGLCKKKTTGMKLQPIIINVLIGSFLSLLFMVWR